MAKLKGVDKVMKNLNREIRKIKNKSMKGLIKSAILILNDTEKTPPLVPVDLSNLRASRFIVTTTGAKDQTGSTNFKGENAGKMNSDHNSVLNKEKNKVAGKFAVAFGFSANYAGHVEKDRGKKNWKRPGSGPEFFESSIKRNKPLVVRMIEKENKI